MKKTIIGILLIFAAVIAVFIAFGHGESGKTGKNTVVFQTLQLSTFDKYINKIISEFENENPDIKIEWIDVPYSEGEKRTLASLLGDNPPDLINLTPDFSLMLAQKHALYEIDDEYLSEYAGAVADLLKYNGKYIGIPFYATSAVTLYNKELIKNFDFKMPPASYDDLFSVHKTGGSEYLTMLNVAENDTLVKILNKYGIGAKETASKESERIFAGIKRLYDEGLIPEDSINRTHRDALEKYMAGSLALVVTGTNFLNMIKENSPETYANTEILPQLTGAAGLYDCSLMNFVIPVKSKQKENALKFALFFTNTENQLEFAKLTGVLPVNGHALENERFKISEEQNLRGEMLNIITASNEDIKEKAVKIAAYQLNYLQPPYKYKGSKTEVNKLYSETIQEILIKNADIPSSLKKLEANLEKL